MADVRALTPVRSTEGGLALVGDITVDVVDAFEAALDACVDAGGFVTIDMAGVSSMDAAVLRVLLAATGRSRSAGGDIVLDSPTTELVAFFDSLGLTWLLTIINVRLPSVIDPARLS